MLFADMEFLPPLRYHSFWKKATALMQGYPPILNAKNFTILAK